MSVDVTNPLRVGGRTRSVLKRRLADGIAEACTNVGGEDHCTLYTYIIAAIDHVELAEPQFRQEPAEEAYVIRMDCDREDTAGSGLGQMPVNIEVWIDGVKRAEKQTMDCGFGFDGDIEVNGIPGDMVEVRISWDGFGGGETEMQTVLPEGTDEPNGNGDSPPPGTNWGVVFAALLLVAAGVYFVRGPTY